MIYCGLSGEMGQVTKNMRTFLFIIRGKQSVYIVFIEYILIYITYLILKNCADYLNYYYNFYLFRIEVIDKKVYAVEEYFALMLALETL